MNRAVAGSAGATEDPRLTRYWALYHAVADEWTRRMRRAILLATLGALLAVFTFGASILPSAVTSNLLLGYLVFLGIFAIVLALSLISQTAGDYRKALTVGEVARHSTWRSWQQATGEAHPPLSRDEAVRWLASHPGSDLPPQRLYAHVLLGDVDGARGILADFPQGTDEQRYDREADEWVLDFMEGRISDLERLEQAATSLQDPEARAVAMSGAALRRATAVHASGGDWIGPMAAAYPAVASLGGDDWRIGAVVRTWTVGMLIVSALIGAALLVGRLTGVWV